MKSIADFPATLDLPPGLLEKAQECLSDLHSLSVTEKEKLNRRLNAAETIFRLAFGENAITKSCSDFAELCETTWSTNCDLAPRIIITPTTAQEVSIILTLCQILTIQFSVRGCGHLHNPGFTSNHDGVVICMRKFNALALSADRSTVEIGLGLSWLEVYRGLEPYELTVTGGRVPSVGVGGLLIGGGLSFQNSEYGLSCSAIVEYEVVLADSSVVKANATENSDLFWALKGGGPNFGIVTKVKMTTIPNKVWAEGLLYSPTMNDNLLHALMQYHESSEKDNKATLIWHSVHEATLVVFFYCAPVETQPDVFRCFDDIPFLARVMEAGCRTVFEVVNGFAGVNSEERKSHDMRTMSSLPDLGVYKAIEECRLQQVQAIKDIPGAILTMVVQPISSSTVNACNVAGGNPLGLEPQSHQWLLLMASWTNPEDEPVMREASRKIIDCAETVSKQNGTFLDFKYSNYASRDQDPLASYGPGNLQRLGQIARIYDPRGVFQRLQFGGWLIRKVGV